jgi:hypothetical protein
MLACAVASLRGGEFKTARTISAEVVVQRGPLVLMTDRMAPATASARVFNAFTVNCAHSLDVPTGCSAIPAALAPPGCADRLHGANTTHSDNGCTSSDTAQRQASVSPRPQMPPPIPPSTCSWCSIPRSPIVSPCVGRARAVDSLAYAVLTLCPDVPRIATLHTPRAAPYAPRPRGARRVSALRVRACTGHQIHAVSG